MEIGYYIISILFGLVPEVLYFYLFLIYTKNIKEHRIKLLIFILISYTLCVLLAPYKEIYYIGFIVLIYCSLKIIYNKKTQIIDIFVFSISTISLSFIGFICSRFVNNNYIIYYICAFVNRILLFVPFIFKDKFNILYKKYCSLWNRNYEKKQPIKSITLRNISLIILNIFIFIMNIISVSMTNFIK